MDFESLSHDADVRITILCEHPGKGRTSDKVKWFEKSETLLLFLPPTYLRASDLCQVPCLGL